MRQPGQKLGAVAVSPVMAAAATTAAAFLLLVSTTLATADAFVRSVDTLDTSDSNMVQEDPAIHGDTQTLAASAKVSGGIDGSPSIQGWWANEWNYRVPVVVNSGNYVRHDKPVEVALNFTTLLRRAGTDGAFDPASLRVIEKDADDNILAVDLPVQFDVSGRYDPVSNAAGTLIFILDGRTEVETSRYFEVYFDVVDKNLPPLSVANQLSLTDNVVDEGQDSYRIETVSATYFYHTEGAGFSSLDDRDGTDWIGYSSKAGNAGRFRGIPNLVHPADGGYFHPGVKGLHSSITRQGPLKITIESWTPDNLWKVRWEIYPGHATLTTLKADAPYWFLYEGAPGGALDSDDIVVQSDGTETNRSKAWCNDTSSNGPLPTACNSAGPDWNREWVYFGDPAQGENGRSLFVAHHQNDDVLDSYRRATGSGTMTIMGFGRINNNPQFIKTGRRFSVGLVDSDEFSTVGEVINSVVCSIGAAPGTVEARTATAPSASAGSDGVERHELSSSRSAAMDNHDNHGNHGNHGNHVVQAQSALPGSCSEDVYLPSIFGR